MTLDFETRQRLRKLVSDARKRRLKGRLAQGRKRDACSGCGAEHQNQTVGCGPCSDRARRRRSRRLDTELDFRQARKRAGLCIGCGVGYEEFTDGCLRCQDRRRYRRAA